MSSLTQLPLYGRKYKIEVTLPDADGSGSSTVLTVADSDFEPSSLRVTFDIFTMYWRWYWTADIEIYNLDQSTTDAILNPPPFIAQGMTVKVSAGYQNGNYGLIWSGPVFQPLWERRNVTDFVITLHCILGLDELTRNNISGSYAAQTNQTDLIRQMAAQAFRPIKIADGGLSDKIKDTKLSRGGAFFGNSHKLISQIAEDNNMQWWQNGDGLRVGKIDDDVSAEPQITYTPDTGLIGTPQQTQWGVQFRTLLDPRAQVQKPAMAVKIDQTSIVVAKKQIGELPGVLDANGIYIVGAVRYLGDTRGPDWYSEITGYTSVGGKLAMLSGLGDAYLNGGG